MAERPLDVLHKTLESPVIVGLKGNKEYRGKLKGYDIHMNIVLEDAEELADGSPSRKLGKVIIRGDSVIFISP
jgi:small nuclear ribonucleoprotein (snRNP)-like protein